MGIKIIMSLVLLTQICLICILQKLHSVHSTVYVINHFGKQVNSFEDRAAFFDSELIVPIEGYIVSAEPQDACHPITPPGFLTNFTMGKFVLINGTETCGFNNKVDFAQEAGYDLAVIFDPYPVPFEYMHAVPYPRIEITIPVIFISSKDGLTIKNNYVYNNSLQYNFKIRITPNTDITYYLYLFGAVIGVCFFVMLLFLMCLLLKCIQERRKRRRNTLSSRQIRQIPTTKFTKGDQYDVCAICFEDYKEGDKLRLLPCSHAYHTKCIDPWLMNNRRNCPLCKRKITFGESEENSDSDDSELTSPAENTPLLASPAHRTQSWGTFAINPAHSPNADGSGPSSLTDNQCLNHSFVPENGTSPESSSTLSAVTNEEIESLLPLPQRSVNHDIVTASDNTAAVQVNFTLGNSHENNDANGHRGLIV